MKILIITTHFWPEEFRINDIAVGFKEKGHEVDILTNIPNYPYGKYFDGYSIFNNRKQIYNGIGIKRLFVIPRGNSSKLMLILNYLTFMLSGIINVPWILKQKYDRILVYQTTPITVAIPAIITKLISKVPIHIYILDLWPETLFTIVNISNKFIKNISYKVCSMIYKSFDKIYISSRGFAKKLSYINKEKIEYVPQWAEDLYKNNTNIKDENIEKLYANKTNIVFAGNIGKAQSIDTIIKAANICKENKNIQWIILGDGSEKKYLDEKIIELGLYNIKALGRKPVEDMPKYFDRADALLVTLTKDELFKITVPAKVQSYMAAGKPVLGCISGEGKELIEEANCGFTCEAEDYKGLSEIALKIDKMNKSELNKYELNKLGLNALNYFNENFDREIVLDNMEEILIGKKGELVEDVI